MNTLHQFRSLQSQGAVFSEVKYHYQVFCLSFLLPNGQESIASGSIASLEKLLVCLSCLLFKL